MQSILAIIKELRADNGKLYKEGILQKHRDNAEWRAYLLAVYNPFETYGVSGDKTNGRDDLDNLKLCRSIDAGITATTINKVYKGLIPTASKMMKAKDKCIDSIKYPVYAGIKYDGNYTNIVVSNGSPKFYTSGGHEYTVRDSHPFTNVPDGVYLAERIGGDGKLGARRLANLRGSKPIQYSIGHTFKVFDYLTLDEFNNDKAHHAYKLRNVIYSRIFCDEQESIGKEELIDSREELEVYMNKVVSQGYEGLVLKQPNMLWRNSKSRKTDFAKYKRRPTADLLCIEEIEGEGKYAGLIGSIMVKDSHGRTFSVGSGLDDNDRNSFGAFVNRVVEIEYEQIMDTYIQPVFLHIREDKTVEDID